MKNNNNIIINVLTNDVYKDTINLPKTATNKSTGYDIIAASDPIVVGEKLSGNSNGYTRIDYIEYKTGLHLQCPENIDVLILPRSSICKYNLILSNSVGLGDNDYTGEYLFRFKYVPQPDDYIYYDTGTKYGSFKKIAININRNKIYKRGDRLGQLKFTNVIQPEFKLVTSLKDTDRGSGGFGSTGIN